MSRASRVPYHQNLYDLLDLEPAECPRALALIAAHEAAHGPLPASVREWYLVPNVVLLEPRPANWLEQWNLNRGLLWWEYSNQDPPTPLPNVLEQFAALTAQRPFVHVIEENQGVCALWFKLDGSDDPPVVRGYSAPEDPDTAPVVRDTLSAFLFAWFASFFRQRWTGVERSRERPFKVASRTFLKPHANGLWLRAPAEPFHPPVLDYLTDHFGEPERAARAGNVTAQTFRAPCATVRVTADEPTLTGALSAWWVHAESAEKLAELAKLLVPFGTLRETLRADTDEARAVLARATNGERPA